MDQGNEGDPSSPISLKNSTQWEVQTSKGGTSWNEVITVCELPPSKLKQTLISNMLLTVHLG